MEPKAPTLDQIAVFLAIVETGSFSAAARKLGRATSVVSYAIANLEASWASACSPAPAPARPSLTDAGRAILADSRGLAIALDGLLAKARGLTAGLEAEVSLVVDVMWPAKKLVKALDEFRKKFPTVGLAPAGGGAGGGDPGGAGRRGRVRHQRSLGAGQRSSDPRALPAR